jgi:hypothetical protein
MPKAVQTADLNSGHLALVEILAMRGTVGINGTYPTDPGGTPCP